MRNALLGRMASKYDQPSSDDTTLWDMTPDEYLEWSQEDGPLCAFCDRPLPEGETDYCDAICAAMADRDNLEDR
jgi:hypothetical protein